MSSYIIIPTNTELLQIPSDYLMYIEADGNYSKVYTQEGKYRQVSFQLGQLEDMIGNQLDEDETPFIRIGKSLIVNKNYIYVVDISRQEIIMSDYQGHFYELSASRKALVGLKMMIESERL